MYFNRFNNSIHYFAKTCTFRRQKAYIITSVHFHTIHHTIRAHKAENDASVFGADFHRFFPAVTLSPCLWSALCRSKLNIIKLDEYVPRLTMEIGEGQGASRDQTLYLRTESDRQRHSRTFHQFFKTHFAIIFFKLMLDANRIDHRASCSPSSMLVLFRPRIHYYR